MKNSELLFSLFIVLLLLVFGFGLWAVNHSVRQKAINDTLDYVEKQRNETKEIIDFVNASEQDPILKHEDIALSFADSKIQLKIYSDRKRIKLIACQDADEARIVTEEDDAVYIDCVEYPDQLKADEVLYKK